MEACFTLKNCFLDKSKLKVINTQPARETLMLLWAFVLMEAMIDESDDLSIDRSVWITPKALSARTDIPLEIVKLGFSLFLQLGIIEQMSGENNKRTDDKEQERNGNIISLPELRQFLLETPLDKISDRELLALGDKHGADRLAMACQIAAETWRRNKKEIRSPGGYLNVLCVSIKIPDWFTPASSIIEDSRRTTDGQQARSKLQKLWESLSDQQQQNYLLKAKHSIPESIRQSPLQPAMMDAIAREIAWNEHLFQWVKTLKSENNEEG